MDRTGQFGEHGVDPNVANTDAAVESPLNVGTDERRMHVRAYNYWVSLLDGRAYPSIEELDPESIEDFGPHSILLDFTAGSEDPAIAFVGHTLRAECALPVEAERVSDIPSRSILSRLTDHYLQIIANRAPIGFEAEFVNDRGNNTMYRGILMPFSSDDDTIDFIYGVINWKEVADGETTEKIKDELQRALDANPPRQEAPVAAWDDGPHSTEVANENEPEAGESALEVSATQPGFAPVSAPAADAEEDEAALFEPTGDESLADWLAAARESANLAVQADRRSRAFLYRALALAYDFALLADVRADEYAELLAASGITQQARAPMTPIVKLVFGVAYDKTRLAEYAMALAHGRRAGVGPGGFQDFIESHDGGLKGVVQAERAERRPDRPAKAGIADALKARARTVMPRGIVELHGEDEFVLLVARRVDAEHVAVLGSFDGGDQALKKALGQITGE